MAQCKAITKKGTRCPQRASIMGYCTSHFWMRMGQNKVRQKTRKPKQTIVWQNLKKNGKRKKIRRD